MYCTLTCAAKLFGGRKLSYTPPKIIATRNTPRKVRGLHNDALLALSQPNDIMMKVEGRRSGLLMLQPPPPAHVMTTDCSLEYEDEDDDVFDFDGSSWRGEAEEGAGTSDNIDDKGSHRDDAEDDEHPPNNKRMKTPGPSSPQFSSSSSGVALSLESWSKMEESDRACSLKENHPNNNESSSWSPVLHLSSSSSLTSSAASNNYSLFGFACSSVRHAWRAGNVISAAVPHQSLPSSTYPPPFVIAATAMKSMADDVYDDDEEEEEDDEDDDEESDDDTHPPGMIPASSGENSDQSSDTSSEDDDDMGGVLLTEEDEDDLAAATLLANNNNVAGGVPNPILRKGVTFNEQVRVLPIPPLQDYTPEQRYKMYANRYELRENKLRNKREYEFDKYDWRNATEEHAMSVCPVSGELLHPVHL